MARRILIVDGHPDPDPARFGHALADAYANGAAAAGHEVRRVTVAALDVPVLRSRAEWTDGPLPPALAEAAAALAWAEHLVFLYPLWLGDLPAHFKAFLEQVARPGIAFRYGEKRITKLLSGRSARIFVTMGMPGLWYRIVYRAHSLKSFERNILNFVGIAPVATSIVGTVEGSAPHRGEWLDRAYAHGLAGD